MSLGATVTLEQLAGDPHPVLARLRQAEPVAWLPAMGGWLVTRRDLAAAVLRDPDAFTVDDLRFSTARVIGPSMLSTDGAEHDRHRAPFVDPFRSTPVRRRFAGWIERRCRDLLAPVVPDGTVDLRSRLAAPLAADVAAEAIGLAAADRPALARWYEAIVAAVDAVTAGDPVPASGVEAYVELRRAVRRAAGGEGTIASAAVAGRLSADELASNAAVILFGAVVTSEGATTAALHYLLSDAEQLALVQRDRSLLPNAVEESMRLEPAAAVVDRYATRDVEIGGKAVAAGDLVRVSLSAANRDPATFPEPDRFDVARPNAAQHITFAVGPHACLGIHLARLESRIAVAAVLDLLPVVRYDADASAPPSGLVFRSPGRVVARWDRRRPGHGPQIAE